MEIENTPLEELEIRIQNLQTIIDAAEMELAILLREQEQLTKRRPIGFILGQHNDEKKTGNERTPHHKPKP